MCKLCNKPNPGVSTMKQTRQFYKEFVDAVIDYTGEEPCILCYKRYRARKGSAKHKNSEFIGIDLYIQRILTKTYTNKDELSAVFKKFNNPRTREMFTSLYIVINTNTKETHFDLNQIKVRKLTGLTQEYLKVYANTGKRYRNNWLIILQEPKILVQDSLGGHFSQKANYTKGEK